MALQLGAENKKRVIQASVVGVLLLFAVVRFFLFFFGSSSPAPAPAPAPQPQAAAPVSVPAPAARVAPASGRPATQVAALNLDPTLHTEWLRLAEGLTYTGRGRNIFSREAAPVVIEKPKAPVRPVNVVQVPQGPPPPPPPPPINIRFFGIESHKSGARRAFLLQGENVFIASEGDVVDRRYKVVKINPFSVEIEDLPYSHTQTISLSRN